MDSPCVNMCSYDADFGLCPACGRTLEEISHWDEMDDDRQRAVLAQLRDRLKALSAPPAS